MRRDLWDPRITAAFEACRTDTARARWQAAENIRDSGEACFTMAADGDRTRLYVRGMIGGWRQDSDQFVRTVHGVTGPIDLFINSLGGYVFDAVAMHDVLDAHPHEVAVRIDGVAASAASFLAMAGDTVQIARGARMMIHDARGYAGGDPKELRAYAELLDAISDDIAGMYAARAGGTRAAWRSRMNATTWYSAEQAVTAKLADGIAPGKAAAAAATVAAATTSTGPDNRTRIVQARLRALTTRGG